jgi:hypothetical protein
MYSSFSDLVVRLRAKLQGSPKSVENVIKSGSAVQEKF